MAYYHRPVSVDVMPKIKYRLLYVEPVRYYTNYIGDITKSIGLITRMLPFD